MTRLQRLNTKYTSDANARGLVRTRVSYLLLKHKCTLVGSQASYRVSRILSVATKQSVPRSFTGMRTYH